MRLTAPGPNQAEQPDSDGGDNTYFGGIGRLDMTSLVDSDEPLFCELATRQHSKRDGAPQFMPLH